MIHPYSPTTLYMTLTVTPGLMSKWKLLAWMVISIPAVGSTSHLRRIDRFALVLNHRNRIGVLVSNTEVVYVIIVGNWFNLILLLLLLLQFLPGFCIFSAI